MGLRARLDRMTREWIRRRQGADRDAIFVRGNTCDVDVVGNSAAAIGGDAVRIELTSGASCRIDCRGNTVSGAAALDPRCTSAAGARP